MTSGQRSFARTRSAWGQAGDFERGYSLRPFGTSLKMARSGPRMVLTDLPELQRPRLEPVEVEDGYRLVAISDSAKTPIVILDEFENERPPVWSLREEIRLAFGLRFDAETNAYMEIDKAGEESPVCIPYDASEQPRSKPGHRSISNPRNETLGPALSSIER